MKLKPHITLQEGHAAAISSNVTILDMFDSFGWFTPDETWAPWRAFLATIAGLPMTGHEASIFRACTGLEEPASTPYTSVSAIVGRRGGKSRIGATIAAYYATYRDYREFLAPGERATIPVIAKDKDDARTLMGYCKAILTDPRLSHLLARDPQAEMISLKNRVDIVIRAANITAGRSRTVPLAILDEVAFFKSDEAVNPDVEIIRGIMPAQATIPGHLLLKLSSPYAQRGVLWEDYREYYGRPNAPTLVWKADTITMHPGNPILVGVIEAAYKDDPTSAAAEYGANFRTDVESFVSVEAIQDATDADIRERPFDPRVATYTAFVDPSGGSSDSFTCAIAHYDPDSGNLILDCLREIAPDDSGPFNPVDAVAEITSTLKSYKVHAVHGDRYGGEMFRYLFKQHGIAYHISDRTKSEIYRDFLPLVNGGAVRLLSNHKMMLQFCSLDRRVSRGGRDSIDHPAGKHDDLANATAGALLLASGRRQEFKEVIQTPLTVGEQFKARWKELVEPKKANRVGNPYAKQLPPHHWGDWK
jgi:hypothetical protein